jgi:hypothetical protein
MFQTPLDRTEEDIAESANQASRGPEAKAPWVFRVIRPHQQAYPAQFRRPGRALATASVSPLAMRMKLMIADTPLTWNCLHPEVRIFGVTVRDLGTGNLCG